MGILWDSEARKEPYALGGEEVLEKLSTVSAAVESVFRGGVMGCAGDGVD